ncbi:MAG TPA: glycoside hydrolase family 125 protein [Cellulomonas sp.]
MTAIEPAVRDEVRRAVVDALGQQTAVRFLRCFDDVLAGTARRLADGTTFVLTGDIPAMWLRDSSAQVRPFLALADRSAATRDLIEGLIARQAAFIRTDPYANAFNAAPDGAGHRGDLTELSPWVWERKYEIDSLAYPLQLAFMYWRATGRTGWCDARFHEAARIVVDVWTVEQDHDARSPYRFERPDAPVPTDTLSRDGRGPRHAPTGMTWAGFRPSDDACTYPYHVPGNAMATVALAQLAAIAHDLLGDGELADRATALADRIRAGMAEHALVEVPGRGRVWAYEVDGLGGQVLMDDANVPSLLSLPMIGFCPVDDPVYRATRELVLSPTNPYFVAGSAAAGIGSPHTPPGTVWPIALAVQGITSRDEAERAELLATLLATDAGTGLMHESFDADDPTRYTRPWFSWANATFCELVLDMAGLPVSPLAAAPLPGERR